MKFLFFISLSILTVQNVLAQEKWVSLFNGRDLSGWDTYIGPSYDTLENKWGSVSVIRISGENFGGISTTQEFENHHLKLEFKWVH
jgi:hypothetical protein